MNENHMTKNISRVEGLQLYKAIDAKNQGLATFESLGRFYARHAPTNNFPILFRIVAKHCISIETTI